MSNKGKGLQEVLAKHGTTLLAEWTEDQVTKSPKRAGSIKESEIRDQCKEFLGLLQTAAQDGHFETIQGTQWSGVRDMLANQGQRPLTS